jgi:cell wall-associated protease
LTPTPTPTSTLVEKSTNTPTATPTSKSTNIPTASLTPTTTDMPTPTSIPTATPTLTLTPKDTTAPAVPSVKEIGDNDKTLKGNAEPLATIKVEKMNSSIGSAKAGSDGSFSIPIPVQKAGTKLLVTATDAAGNISKPTVVIVKDKTPPAVPEVNKIKSKTKTVTGKAEAYALVVIKGKNTIGFGYAKSNGTFSIAISKQKAGTTLYVTAKDKAGYISTPCKVIVGK